MKFTVLPKLNKGDQVAIISPSAGLPGLFPWVFELGLQRLRDEFELVPKEYPTTRQMNSSLKDRARDIMAAFSDPNNKAVFSSIGGADQAKLIKYLDSEILKKNVKPFFGFSDNTHLCNFLWKNGIPSYYGGAIMTQFAMQSEMQTLTKEFLKHALFTQGEVEIHASETCIHEGLDWGNKDNLNKRRKIEPNVGWYWYNPKNIEGRLWGGCVESLVEEMTIGKYLPSDIDLENTVLFLETAEDIPDHWIVEYLLTGFGERGWFDKFNAVLIGRPKAWDFSKPFNRAEKDEYCELQRKTVEKTVREYSKSIPIVQNIDFGHTDPQIVLPMGSTVRIDADHKRIFFNY